MNMKGLVINPHSYPNTYRLLALCGMVKEKPYTGIDRTTVIIAKVSSANLVLSTKSLSNDATNRLSNIYPLGGKVNSLHYHCET